MTFEPQKNVPRVNSFHNPLVIDHNGPQYKMRWVYDESYRDFGAMVSTISDDEEPFFLIGPLIDSISLERSLFCPMLLVGPQKSTCYLYLVEPQVEKNVFDQSMTNYLIRIITFFENLREFSSIQVLFQQTLSSRVPPGSSYLETLNQNRLIKINSSVIISDSNTTTLACIAYIILV